MELPSRLTTGAHAHTRALTIDMAQEAAAAIDSSVLLRIVDELGAIMSRAREKVGLKDMLLRLHGMAHTVINGTAMSVSANEESLPELAFDVSSEVLEIVSTLRRWQSLLEVLEQLAPRTNIKNRIKH